MSDTYWIGLLVLVAPMSVFLSYIFCNNDGAIRILGNRISSAENRANSLEGTLGSSLSRSINLFDSIKYNLEKSDSKSIESMEAINEKIEKLTNRINLLETNKNKYIHLSVDLGDVKKKKRGKPV